MIVGIHVVIELLQKMGASGPRVFFFLDSWCVIIIT